MRFTLDIDYPAEKMEASRKRLEARGRFAYHDRVPVGFCLGARYCAPFFGMNHKDFFKDAETQYYWHLQFAKFRIENIPDDLFCTGPVVYVYPNFDNVVNAIAFGAELVSMDYSPLWSRPTIKTVEQMERLEIPPVDAGLWGKRLDWWYQMKELVSQTRLTFNGQEGRVELEPPTIGFEGPHMIAVDLVGEDFYWWMVEYPEACHRFLDKITTGMIRTEQYFRQLDPRPRPAFGLAEDSSQIMSARMFQEFTLPYTRRMYDTFGQGLADGRGMHMCGNSTHLHQALIEDARITSFNVFGYQTAPQVVAHNMGGRVYLWGNVSPMLMLNGTKAEVKAAAKACLEALAPCGGFVLGDGANVCPGTPLENLAALTEAAEEYGRPEVTFPIRPVAGEQIAAVVGDRAR